MAEGEGNDKLAEFDQNTKKLKKRISKSRSTFKFTASLLLAPLSSSQILVMFRVLVFQLSGRKKGRGGKMIQKTKNESSNFMDFFSDRCCVLVL